MENRPWEKFLTKEEFWSLTREGRMQANYWAEWLPNMCGRMKKAGTLYPTLKANGEHLSDLLLTLMEEHGYPEDGAMEVIKQEVYALTPEENEEETAELLEAELRHLWTMSGTTEKYETFKKKPDVIARAKANIAY